MLYGKTADVVSAKKNGVVISLGSDWSPTGSKNLLWELKVADLYNKNSLNKIFSDLELAEMVTLNPAKAIGVADQIGSIKPGLFADIVIFDNLNEDPYRNLLQCTEKNLKLSIIGGRPRYGDVKILSKLEISVFEKLKVGSASKGIDILESGVDFGEITFEQVRSRLTEALANPKNTALKLFNRMKLRTLEEGEPLRLIIEDENEEMHKRLELRSTSTFKSFLQSNFDSEDISSTPIDAITMYEDHDFFPALKANPNIPPYMLKLKDYLR